MDKYKPLPTETERRDNSLVFIKQIEAIIEIFPQKETPNPQGSGDISDKFLKLLRKK